MRSTLILAMVCLLAFFSPQNDLWQQVRGYSPLLLKNYVLSETQLVGVKKALKARVDLDGWPCAEEDDPGWTENLKFEELPVSVKEKIVLVEAGLGCARGGQGSNGAMWIIRFQGDKFSFLATPQQQFNGWIYSIQPTTGHGFRDLVLAWHMSAAESDLSYFRFNGTSYRRISTATTLTDTDGVQKIFPKRAP
jgi:hypothetical protein